jgi:hypothetical protein
MREYHDILTLTEAQAVALRDQLQEIDLFRGLHLYMRAGKDKLRIGSDGWPGEVHIYRDGTVDEVTP